jgi:rhodanese-related sulfurtransferase
MTPRFLIPVLSVASLLIALAGCSKPQRTTDEPAKAEPAKAEPAEKTATVGDAPATNLVVYGNVSLDVCRSMIATQGGRDDFVILDLRTAGEYGSGHIEGAVLLDYRNPDFADKLKGLDKSKTYLIHCASGGRSGQASSTFTELGFAKVYHMHDGMNGWKRAGYPIARD